MNYMNFWFLYFAGPDEKFSKEQKEGDSLDDEYFAESENSHSDSEKERSVSEGKFNLFL